MRTETFTYYVIEHHCEIFGTMYYNDGLYEVDINEATEYGVQKLAEYDIKKHNLTNCNVVPVQKIFKIGQI